MGGATISFLNMIIGLKKKGVTPIVIIPKNYSNDERLLNILSKNEIEYYKAYIVCSLIDKSKMIDLVVRIKFILKLPFMKYRSKKELEAIVLKVKPDIIHTNVGVVHEGYHIAKKYKIPHVWHLREYQTKDFHWHIYPNYLFFCKYLRGSYVITITDGIKSYFKLDDYSKAQTIYNGIYRKEEAIIQYEKENYFFLSSRISPEKGHLDVIKAFGRFSGKNDYRLKIAGEGDEMFKQQIITTAKVFGCEDRIDFLGFLQDVKPMMARAKALIVASYYEAFGRMTAEAAFCGTMVVGRNTAGTKEILDTTGGLLFNNIEEMTLQMEAVKKMSSRDYQDRIMISQERAIENYSIEGNVNKVLCLYHKICDIVK